jgi:hypothetical protein
MNDPAPRADNEKAIIIILACGSPSFFLTYLLSAASAG